MQNFLINGGFDFFQRQVAATATARTDDTYGPDRWYVLTQTAGINVNQAAGDTKSKNAVRLTQNQAAAQRFGLAQIVESRNSLPLRGETVRFQARLNISNSQDVRIALLEWTGTADAVTSDVVNDWTSSTYTAGNFFLAANLTVTAVSETASPSAGSWVDISVSGAVSASCNNLIVFIWVEGEAAQNVTLDLTEAGAYLTSTAQEWVPRLLSAEFVLCQRYCWSIHSDAVNLNAHVGFGEAASTTIAQIPIPLPIEMFSIPTLVATATDWEILDYSVARALTAIALAAAGNDGRKSLVITCTVASGLTAFRPYALRADGTDGRILYLTAEL